MKGLGRLSPTENMPLCTVPVVKKHHVYNTCVSVALGTQEQSTSAAPTAAASAAEPSTYAGLPTSAGPSTSAATTATARQQPASSETTSWTKQATVKLLELVKTNYGAFTARMT